jgi:hypothetical protein
MNKDLNAILSGWPAEPGAVVARTFVAPDGSAFIQLRVDLGLLQMALDGRPDGERPEGFETSLECVRDALLRQPADAPLGEEQQQELTREMLQFYRRRVSLMALAKQAQQDGDTDRADAFYRRAIRDADHNLAILDLLGDRGVQVDISEHEQYRPFIIMHRAACRAERLLLEQDPDEAIEQLKAGMAAIRDCATERVEIDEESEAVLDLTPFVRELKRFEKHIRRKYRRRRTLREQLAAAVAAEDFEQAARLRDALAARTAEKNSTGE